MRMSDWSSDVCSSDLPGRFHQGILERVLAAGATVVGQCAVTAIARDGKNHCLTTAQGRLQARDVVIATNGYTGAFTPWLRRRVIPIGSYMIATRSEEHTSELQSLMRISYAVFCLKKKKNT